MKVHVSSDVRDISAPRAVVADGVTVRQRDVQLDQALAGSEMLLRQPDGRRDEATARTRTMYRRFGVDPTRTRPSSEALLRRLRKGERLPSISNVVDIINWCSVELQVPFGLYDRQAIADAVTLRLGRPDEWYQGIGKDRVNVAGRLVAADEDGPFGNPTSDSARAMVTEATHAACVVLYLPADTPEAVAAHAVTLTLERLRVFAGASVAEVEVQDDAAQDGERGASENEQADAE